LNKENLYKDAFAQVIKNKRLTLGISQEELASRSEMHVVNISKIESGKSLLLIVSLFKISTGLGITASQLLILVENVLKNKNN